MNVASPACSPDASPRERLPFPGERARWGRRHAVAVGVHAPKSALRVGVALLGRLSKPSRRGCIVVRDTAAVRVHGPKKRLRGGVALAGCLSKPARRSRIV